MHVSPAMVGLSLCLARLAAAAELANDCLVVRLDPKDGYAISGVANRAHGIDFIARPSAEAETDRSLWVIRVRDALGAVHELRPADGPRASGLIWGHHTK